MTTLSESPASFADCIAVADEFAGLLPGLDLGFLRIVLQFLQGRLGTAAEQPCDLERVQALGHEINNRLTALSLQRDLRHLGDPSAPIPT